MANSEENEILRARTLARVTRRAVLRSQLWPRDRLPGADRRTLLEAAATAQRATEPATAAAAARDLEQALERHLLRPRWEQQAEGRALALAAEGREVLAGRRAELTERGRRAVAQAVERAERAQGAEAVEAAETLNEALNRHAGSARPALGEARKQARKLTRQARRCVEGRAGRRLLDAPSRQAIGAALDGVRTAEGVELLAAVEQLDAALDTHGWRLQVDRRTVREGRRLAREAFRLLRRRRIRAVLGADRCAELREPAEAVRAGLRRARCWRGWLAPWLGGEFQRRYLDALGEVHRASQTLERRLREHARLFLKSTTREYVESIGGAILIALAIRAFLFEPFRIPSGSMLPTLEVGDHIFVNKYHYGLRIPFFNAKLFYEDRLPARGDVIVFVQPETGEDYIKRTVGLPGDRVEVLDGFRLRINGEDMPLRRLGEYRYASEEQGYRQEHRAVRYEEDLDGRVHEVLDEQAGKAGPSGVWVVPAGTVLVMGDNRDNSYDGRSWGFVPLENIKGDARFIWFAWASWDRYGRAVQ